MIAQANVTLPELVEDLNLVLAPPAGGLSWWWIVAGIIAVLALVVPLYLTFRPRKPLAEGGATPKPDPAEIALRRLDALKSALAGFTQREAAIELALREHLSGYRSHTTLLAGITFVFDWAIAKSIFSIYAN